MSDLLLSFGKLLEQTPGLGPFEEIYWLSGGVFAVHYFSFFFSVGTMAIVDLRLLGLAGRGQAVTPLAERLRPWTLTGMGIAFLSGFIMFAPDATDFFYSTLFCIKLLAALLAVVFTFKVYWNVRKWDQAPAIPIRAKLTAFISLALWLGVIFAAGASSNYSF